MKLIAIGIATVLVVDGLPALAEAPQANRVFHGEHARKLSPIEQQAVLQAIVDEIYANNLQGYQADVGKQLANYRYQIKVYFKPTLTPDGRGWIIYKLMPYGQVYRMFSLSRDGLAILYGKPNNFRPTQPSYLTVYMDDADLCRFEKKALKAQFDLALKPSSARVTQAVARQRQRAHQ